MERKIYKEEIIDGICTVPDLKLDWNSLLSDKYKLWSKYEYTLLKFYYSPNHEGSCADIAQEFNDSPYHLNASVMNFGRAVQNAVGTFSIMKESKMQYWPISMDGYHDSKNHFVWRMKSELVAAIKRKMEHRARQKEEFLKRFPLESLRNMSLEQYTNLNRKDSFCYWLESKSYGLGSIWGGSSLKFGIYRYANLPKDTMPAFHDDKYCWLAKYKCETSSDAFNLIRERVASIAEKAAQGNLKEIEDIDMGDAIKWKIAFIYSDNKVINLYKKELLQAAAKDFGFKGDLNSRSEMNEFITSKYDKTKESFHDFYTRVGIHYFGKTEKEETMPTEELQEDFAHKYEEYIELLKENYNLVLTGAPGTGKTYMAQAIAKEMGAETTFVQFHPSYDYTDFVEGLRPIKKNDGQIGFEHKDGIFKEFCRYAIKNLTDSEKSVPMTQVNKVYRKPYVFIIDEINRGEVSKIFGELFYAIDPGYRGRKDYLVKTQYQNLIPETDVFSKGFYVPENVYILATMNDIDRSVESMDFAMRRRFTWKEITPSDTKSMLDTLSCSTEANETMTRLNKIIAETSGLGSAFQIGPSYFLKLGENGGDFSKLWKMNIEPLLKEYLRGFRNASDILGKFENAYFDTKEEKHDDMPELIDEN